MFINFPLLQEELDRNYQDIRKIRLLLKKKLNAQHIELFFYCSARKVFFDKTKELVIEPKFLDDSSLIGYVFLKQETYFIPNVLRQTRYNLALDNPFKADINNQLIIPVVHEKKVIGIVRCTQISPEFTSYHFRDIHLLQPSLIKIFTHVQQDDSSDPEEFTAYRMRILTTMNEIKRLYDVLYECAKNDEAEKLILNGKNHLNDIFAYLNPSLHHTAKVQRTLQQLQSTSTQVKLAVLIADDVRINVQMLKVMISGDQEIENISFAYDGLETLKVLDESLHPFHILFLDHHMPGVLGTEIAKKLKLANSPTVIVSITNDDAIMEQYGHLYDYRISKPFMKEKVQEIIATIKKEKLMVS